MAADLRDRIVQLIEKERISQTEFADYIGVQRSALSHVLNGRNNPGFNFIQKIIESYPKVNSRWLLIGEGNIYTTTDEDKIVEEKIAQDKDPQKKVIEPDLFSVIEELKSQEIQDNSYNKKTVTEEKEKTKVAIENVVTQPQNADVKHIEETKIQETQEEKPKEKQVEKVLIFYTDRTFECYWPT